MITANGKGVIKRYLAGQIGQIAGSLSVGVGTTAATVNDTRLVYEVERLNLTSISVDPDSDKFVFQATLPPGRIKTIYEVGVWSSPVSQVGGRTLGIFGDGLPWTNATINNANGRINQNTMQISYTANGTTNAELVGISENLSEYSASDSIVIGYHVTINISSIRVRLGTDASNYFEFLLPASTANSYNVARLALSSATVVGTPSWAAITYLAVRPSATAAGGGNLYFDGIRVDRNSLNEDSLLVARNVLATPYVVNQSIDNDIEYALAVTIS